MDAESFSKQRLHDTNPLEGTSMKVKYAVLMGFAALLLLIGFCLTPSLGDIVAGYKAILTHPAMPDFDGFYWAGSLGVPFINSGLMVLFAIALYYFTKSDLQGVHIASIMLVAGFSFYGKSPLHSAFPALGVILYGKITHKKIKELTAVICFSGALSPVFGVMAFGTEALNPGSGLAITFGIVLGTISGILMGMFAQYLTKLHKGRILYNAAFAAGLTGMLMNGLQIALGIGHAQYPYMDFQYTSGQNQVLGLMLAILFTYLIILGLSLGGWSKYRSLFWHRCFGGDFIKEFGFPASLINMGVVGFTAMFYVFLTGGGELSGPVFAAIFTALGFAAAGVTLREFLPTMAGVFLMAFLTGGIASALDGGAFIAGALSKVSSRSMLLAAIFSCGIAPVVGSHGWLAGVFVGAVHSMLVTITGALHGWMSLYNNGLSLCLIAVFLLPIYSRLHLKGFVCTLGPDAMQPHEVFIRPLSDGEKSAFASSRNNTFTDFHGNRDDYTTKNAVVLKDRTGSCTIPGHFKRGSSFYHLPKSLGINKYRFTIVEGTVELHHLIDGFDTFAVPIDGQTNKYVLEEGKSYEIEIDVKKHYDTVDIVYITNRSYRKPASFNYEVL